MIKSLKKIISKPKEVNDSYTNLSTRADSIRNNFDTKNVVNADNVFFAPQRRVGVPELENIYIQNTWVNECVNRMVRDIYKNGYNIILPEKYKSQTEEFEKHFLKKYKEIIRKNTFDCYVYGGALTLKRDTYQQPLLNDYELSNTTKLLYIPYVQYQGIPNFIEGTSIIDGAKIWNIGTAGSVLNSYAVSWTNRSIPYSRQEFYKYQGQGIIESNLVLIKLCMTILDSLANSTFRNGALAIKVKGNHETMTSANSEKLVQFFSNLRLINQGLNSTAMINIDTEEDVKVIEFDLSKYDAILNTTVQFLIGLFGYSATSVLGASPKGFNSTGESEISLNADAVKRNQDMVHEPILEIMKIEAYQYFGEEVDINFEFNNPIVLSRKDEAEIQGIEIENAVKMQEITAVEGLDYLYKRDVIEAEEYDRRKKEIEEFDDIDELTEEEM